MLFNLIRMPLAALFALSIVSSTSAQQEQIKALAASMADSVARSKNKTVVVFDFAGADRRLGPLGTKLADDFNTALAAPGRKLQLQDRSRLKKMVEDNGLEPENINDDGIATWLAADIGAQALILGTLDRDGESVDLSVSSYRVRDGGGIANFKVAIPLTNEMRGLIPDTVEKDSLANIVLPTEKCVPSSSMPCADSAGFSAPKCIHCPSPPYSPEALDKKVQGTVTLVVVINETGRAEDIRVFKAFPYGLTLQAIRGVQTWTFQPATGPDGKPTKVRQVIQVTFHLF